ncbi:MAG TPA: helix-turn-helix domain-containing protein [Smithellaceae bacterium]|jgi:AcrR family transcriptional regulator|nr:helix-turn-helix domain-containing protein [Smithellaceae bacterium]
MQAPDLKMSEKEKKILDAAIAVISEKGFSAASTSEIARQAGVAEGTIFRYFKTKKDILRGILIHLGNVIAELLVVYGLKKILYQDGREDLRAGIKLVLKDRMAMIDAVFPMLRIVITEAMYHEDIRQILYDKIISRSVEVFEEYHREMVEKGLMKREIDAVVAGRGILGNLVLFFVYRNLFGPMIQLDDYDRELDQVIDAIMYGIAIPAVGDKK